MHTIQDTTWLTSSHTIIHTTLHTSMHNIPNTTLHTTTHSRPYTALQFSPPSILFPTLNYSEVGPNLIRWPQSPKYFDTLIELETVWTLESRPQKSSSLQTCKISEQKSLPGTQAATFNANFLFIVFSFSFLRLKLWFHFMFMFMQ